MSIIKLITAFSVGSTALVGLIYPNNLTFKQTDVQDIPEPIIYNTNDKEIKNENFAEVYALRDTKEFYNDTLTSGTISDIPLGKKVIIYGEVLSNNESYFITLNGYIRHSDFTYNNDYVFFPEESIMYSKDGALILDAPNEWGYIIEELSLNKEIHVTGKNQKGYYQIEEQRPMFIHENDLMQHQYIERQEQHIINISPSYNTSSGTGHLSPSTGVYYGPSGKESYYNLNMSGVIANAQNAGIQGSYWVRNDGVKMYGDYVICACAYSIRPRGTVVATSLGSGICLDTGGFAYNDPYQIDIAVTW